MIDRLPRYFRLSEYNISPTDVVRFALQCQPEDIRPQVMITPIWYEDMATPWADSSRVISKGRVYEIEADGLPITVIRSGVGAPQTGDVVLALGCTPCESLIFTGSVGGLTTDQLIGDLMPVEKTVIGEGFSRYLSKEDPPRDLFHSSVFPDEDLTRLIGEVADEKCRQANTPFHRGAVYATDTIIAQFIRLPGLSKELGCIGIEMETSATFSAARLVGIRGAALLQVSDVIPVHKSLFSGRNHEDRSRRRSIRRTLLPEIIVEALQRLGAAANG